jgi:hypothetical protein
MLYKIEFINQINISQLNNKENKELGQAIYFTTYTNLQWFKYLKTTSSQLLSALISKVPESYNMIPGKCPENL